MFEGFIALPGGSRLLWRLCEAALVVGMIACALRCGRAMCCRRADVD